MARTVAASTPVSRSTTSGVKARAYSAACGKPSVYRATKSSS